MDKIAFALQGGYIYWSAVVLVLAALTAALAFFALCSAAGIKKGRALLCAVIAVVLSLLLARFVHWYCRHEQYESFAAAMTGAGGGFSLPGVIAGCALSALLTGGVRHRGEAARLLDCLAPAGMLGIALGRLSSFFTAGGRGWIVYESGTGLPIASEVVNAATGVAEPRFATFLFQSAEGFIFAALLGLFFFRPLPRPARRDGDVALLFLALWGAGELVMDSTRYDALYLRSNGFVSVVQIASLLSLVLVMAVFSLRSIKLRGLGRLHWLLWASCLAATGLAAWMEYHVQRHGNAYVMCYCLMALAMAVFLSAIWAMYRLGTKNPRADNIQTHDKAAL